MARIQQWSFEQRDIRLRFGLSLKAWPGTCYSLSYDWCKSVLSGRVPEEGDYDVAKSYMWTITSQHRAYRDTIRGGIETGYQWLSQLSHADCLVLREEAKGDHMDQTMAQVLDDESKIPRRSAVIVSSEDHAMAFAKQERASYFFDPNEGQYKVWGMLGDETVAILNANGYRDKWWLHIMTGQPRDKQHYLHRGNSRIAA